MKDQLYEYILMLGDNAMILGHRLSELCGHGPNLETDIALTNISLDLYGQVRSYFQYAAELKGGDATEDSIAFLREEREYRNVLLVEQANTDFAYVIGRQFLFDAFHLPLLEQLCNSADTQIQAIAQKSIKEIRYHHRFSSEWVKRLGGGTAESHTRMQEALNHLYPYTKELFTETEIEAAMRDNGKGADLALVKAAFDASVESVCNAVGLTLPEQMRNYDKGKYGIHSEHMGFMLSQLQYMQRAYPNMQW
ncbi:MAG: phenylacetate-CoA oxygenase subunit PaaC [Saprospiraceae bacterium]|nr:phenylacetate-CoA oxygenase subunit PaaC [Saprospiraceae bacterium]